MEAIGGCVGGVHEEGARTGVCEGFREKKISTLGVAYLCSQERFVWRFKLFALRFLL